MGVSQLITLLLFWVYAIGAIKNKGELISSLARHFQVKCVSLLYSAGQDYGVTIFALERYLSNQYIFSQNHVSSQHGVLHVMLQENHAAQFLNKNDLKSGIWVLYLQSDILLEEYLKDVNIPLDCEFLVAQPEDDYVVLTEVYRISPKLPLQKLLFGNWGPTAGLTSLHNGIYEMRKNLQGITLVGAVKEGPATTIVQTSGDEIVQIGGFIGKLWSILMAMGNFTTKYVKPADNAFGVNVRGTWTGMMGMLQRNEVDIISTDILMDKPRLHFVDFLPPLFGVRTYMYTRYPDNLTSDWRNFLKPFNTKLWLAILSSVLVLAITLNLTLTTERCVMPRNQHQHSLLQFKVQDCLFCILSSFCLQAQDWWLHLPESSRILVIGSYLTALVLCVGYSGFLVSYLAFRTNELPFRTFRQFLQDGTYQIGVLGNSIHYTYFKESTDVAMKQVFNKYIRHNKSRLSESFLEGLQRICKFERYNFMAPVFIASSLLQKLECRIVEVPEAFIPATATMALAKNSPYQGLFSYYLRKVHYSGVLNKLSVSYIVEKLDALSSRNQAPDLNSLNPLLLFLALGSVLATVAMILEIVIYKKRRGYAKTRNRVRNFSY